MTPEAEAHVLLQTWAAAIGRADYEAIGALFARDALFVATAPAPLVGRTAIIAYYRGAPKGLTARPSVQHALRLGAGLRIVASVDFRMPAGVRAAQLTLVTRRVQGSQAISLYHAAVTA